MDRFLNGKSPSPKDISGVEPCIPNAKPVDDPEEESHLLVREVEEDSSDHEY